MGGPLIIIIIMILEKNIAPSVPALHLFEKNQIINNLMNSVQNFEKTSEIWNEKVLPAPKSRVCLIGKRWKSTVSSTSVKTCKTR